MGRNRGRNYSWTWRDSWSQETTTWQAPPTHSSTRMNWRVNTPTSFSFSSHSTLLIFMDQSELEGRRQGNYWWSLLGQSSGMAIAEPLYVLLLRRPMKDTIQYNRRINRRKKVTGSWKQNRKKKSQNNSEGKFLEIAMLCPKRARFQMGEGRVLLKSGAKKRKIKLEEELACLGINRL